MVPNYNCLRKGVRPRSMTVDNGRFRKIHRRTGGWYDGRVGDGCDVGNTGKTSLIDYFNE